ncbi:MAG: hypothetical protein J3K34DRAFT_127039 [Monoraphidium minutum]|nr:MAG: hypothetical protein J3K34DRAFT_127039 [Monoraphidium minutum]
MQQSVRCLQRSGVLPRTTGPQRTRVVAVAARQQQQQARAAKQQHEQQQEQERATGFEQVAALVALAAASPLVAPLAALAEDAAAAEPQEFSPAFYAVAVAPLLIYALFWLYRDRVNPKATFGDLLYIVGAVVVFGNIISIVVFKTRFF